MDWTTRLGRAALLAMPGAALVYTSFNGGGFFPNTPAFVAIVLIEALVLRVTLAQEPVAGVSRVAAIAALGLAVFAGWTLLSATWSDATGRALIEFDRALLYLVAFVLMGSVAWRRADLRWLVRGLVAGFLVVCAAALLSRILPHVLHTSPGISNQRLSYPLTYWNALGAVAAIGFILSFHLTSATREPVPIRVMSAIGPPVFATTLFFTLSRGAIVAGAAGFVAYLLVARPRYLVHGLIASGPATAVAVIVAYGADKLSTANPTVPAGVEQGKHVAFVLLLCLVFAVVVRAVLLLAHPLIVPVELPPRLRMPVLATAGAVGLVLAVAFSAAADAPGYASRQWDRFIAGAAPKVKKGDLRQRLTDPSSNGRTEHWRVALNTFDRSSVKGAGAATYEIQWARHRRTAFRVKDGHGLYFEVASELGLVGLVSLLVAVLGILVGLALRARGGGREIYGALFAAGVCWALHAGVDWDWEMPAVTLWFFAAGGAALAARPRDRPAAPVPRTVPVLIGLALLATAVTPVLITLSQGRLDDSGQAFGRRDCRTASNKATASLRVLSVRGEPYEILAYCDLRRGFPGLAVKAMREGIKRDPHYWGYRYGLAVALGADGRDPRPAMRVARRLNPKEPVVLGASRRFERSSRAGWKRAALTAREDIVREGLLAYH